MKEPGKNIPFEELRRLQERQAKLVSENERLHHENRLLREKVDFILRRMFGSSSEKLHPGQLELMLSLAEEAKEAGKDEASLLLSDDREAALSTKPRAKREARERVPAHLPAVEEVIEPEEVAAEPAKWRRIGEERTEMLDCDPPKYYRRVIVRPKYVSREDNEAAPVVAPLPAQPQERCIAAPGLLASIAVAKYCDHLPLYRQESILRTRHGIALPRSTLARWMELVAFWLEPVYRHLRAEVLQSGYVQIDERSRGRGDHRLPKAARRVRRSGDRSIKHQSSISTPGMEKPGRATFGLPTRLEATRSSIGKQAAPPRV